MSFSDYRLIFLRKQRGYLPRIKPATLLFRLETQESSQAIEPNLKSAIFNLARSLEIAQDKSWQHLESISDNSEQMAALAVMAITTELQINLGLPLRQKPECNQLSPRNYILAIPSTEYSWQATAQLFSLCLDFLAKNNRQEEQKSFYHLIQNEANKLKSSIPQNVNTLAFLRAAQQLGIPTKPITMCLYRYGWGKHAKLMDSSLTELTPAIGCNAARDKLMAKCLLQEAGLPIAPGIKARTPTHAWELAQKLGLPVVVKPQSADGGLEVHVKLSTRTEIITAAQAVLEKNHRILVEKYYNGKDYRFQVFRGEVFRCIERIPGGVIGNGTATIESLVKTLNCQPDRGPKGRGKRKRPIELDLEAQRMLNQQGLTATSVPENGRFVALRGAANISRGGEIKDLLEKVHPDNLLLAIKAAETLKLDLAGVDIIMGDIGTSWLDAGAIICEVNAQPQIAEGHEFILSKLIPGQGRIQVDIIIGLNNIGYLLRAIKKTSRSISSDTGFVGQDGIFAGDRQYCPSTNQFEAISSLLGNQTINHLILAPWDLRLLHDGLPIDRFNRLIILCESHERLSNTGSLSKQLSAIEQLSRCLTPMCSSVYNASSIQEICTLLNDRPIN